MIAGYSSRFNRSRRNRNGKVALYIGLTRGHVPLNKRREGSACDKLRMGKYIDLALTVDARRTRERLGWTAPSLRK